MSNQDTPKHASSKEPKTSRAPQAMDGADLLQRWDQHRSAASSTPQPAPSEAKPKAKEKGKGKEKDGGDPFANQATAGRATYDFPPPRWPRLVLGLSFLVSAGLAVPAVLSTIRTPSDFGLGIALALTAFALIFWWGMLSASPERVRIVTGVVEVAKGTDLKRFDLRDRHQRVQMFGVPRSPRWKVAFDQVGAPPYVISARMVRAKDFTRAVEVYRGPMYPR